MFCDFEGSEMILNIVSDSCGSDGIFYRTIQKIEVVLKNIKILYINTHVSEFFGLRIVNADVRARGYAPL